MSRFGVSLLALLVAQLLLWVGLEFTKPERSIHEEKSRALIQMDVKSVKGLEVSSESETLRFDLEGGIWRDRNQPNFPVNQKKLVEFLSRITELRRGLPVSFSENSYDRFEVSEEEYVLKVSLELTKLFAPEIPFIFMSTNKVYGDNPNKLKFYEKKLRWEIKNQNEYYKGIAEKFPIDDCTHSFFGVSKTYADLIVQEYGKNIGLKTACFRAGCITGPNHSSAKLHGFLSYLVKSSLSKKKYTIIGYKGKQVRDNLHSFDLVNCFWEFYKKPKKGEVYNIGGGRYSNCSVIEALNLVEKLTNIKIQKQIIKTPRVGDHIWYISNLSKFKKHYPKWKQKYNTKKIIEELIEYQL